ncbi:hypothetical protein K505DRAFT_306450 [Melanomma pulvis-pyrius CBS 109.77]|uniref:Uncharacterized protein n=1 Tax=Melanomma pulvis-pyrius CBS 109.77 TaxID=1314802 RepID=A0A6A6X9K8_9PLEO|nr:hypothetical protein K505DRAFT_306450 [Melanomma pulvis-pyrius CBS 109.77]
MAEGLATVAIISSIVQLVDFTSKVIARLNEFHSGTSDIPKSLSHLKAELPLVSHTLQQILEALNAGLFSKECTTALQPTIQGCQGSVVEIDSILEKTLPRQGDGRARKALKSVGSVLSDGKIENITTTLRGYVGTLGFYFAASSSTLKPLTDAKLVTIRQWLSAPDPSTNYHKALSLRQNDTGLWLLESDLYKKWTVKASSIWLHGIPGCGKTILSSTLLENILEHASGDPGKSVAYFYFDFNDKQKQDPQIMVRSLISQLSQQCIKISPGLNGLYSSCGNGQRQPSPAELLQVLRQLIEERPCTYIIIDALDECGSRRELMSIVKNMLAWKLQGIHLLCTSRREGDIESTLGRILDDKNILCIQSKAVDLDIQSYVRQRLSEDDSLRKWQNDAIIREKIESSLMEGAHGMFRWAACQLDILGDCRNRRQLLQALADLPPNLDETYNRILGAIKESDIPYALRILRWLAFSLRPLLLAEVAEIAAIEANRYPAFDRDEVLEDPLEVLNVCSSLVTVVASSNLNNPGRPVLHLAHYSVKEYLVSKRILKSKACMYAMEPELCHRSIAKCCLQYLLQFDRPNTLNNVNLNEFALAKYSAEQWVTHLKSSREQDPESIALAVNLLNAEGAAYLTWLCLYDPDVPWRGTYFTRNSLEMRPALYSASQTGLADVVRRLVLELGADINAQGGEYGNALQAASFNGYLDVAQFLFLVEKGANVNAQGGRYGNALQAASVNGYLDVAQFLVEKGAVKELIEGL